MYRTTNALFPALACALLAGMAAEGQTPPTAHTEAVTTIRHLGGTVNTTGRAVAVTFVPFGERHLIPLQHVRGLISLDLTGQPLTNSHLIHLQPLTELRTLQLANTHITDAGLANLGRLQNLEELDLSGTNVSDAGLLHLEGLKNLKIINLVKTKVTEKGLVRLKAKLKKLRIIRKKG